MGREKHVFCFCREAFSDSQRFIVMNCDIHRMCARQVARKECKSILVVVDGRQVNVQKG